MLSLEDSDALVAPRTHHVRLCANGGILRRHDLVDWPFDPGGSQCVGAVGSAHLLSPITLPQLEILKSGLARPSIQ